MATNFDDIIKEHLNEDTIKVKGTYSVPSKGGKLIIDNRDKVNFKILFDKSPNKGVGNGEVSLYWLFNYGKKKGRAQENRFGDAADLIIDKKNCEVKSYPNHDSMTLGKFKSDYESQEIITYLFAFSNLFVVFGGSSKGSKSFKSLLQFNIKDIKESLDLYNTMYKLFKEHKELEKYKIFKDIKSSMSNLKTTLKKISTTNFNNTEKLAGDIIANFVINKFSNKPGANGYMVNCKIKDPTDIHFHFISFSNFNKNYEILKKSFSVNSGEISIKLLGLFG